LTASDVRSAAVETTAAAAAGSGWPLSDQATAGVGTPVTANCCARPAPAFSVRVDSSGRSGTSFGAAAPPTPNPRPRVKTTPQKETREFFYGFSQSARFMGASTAEWLACWTRAWMQIAPATLSGKSLRQIVHTHRALFTKQRNR